MTELNFGELSLEQKFGMVYTAYWDPWHNRENNEWILQMIKKRALGSVWIQAGENGADEFMERVKEIADYPILIFTDAESGIGDFKIGKHNAIGCTASEEYAYAFGKAVGVTARKMGYNVVCDPVVDISECGSARSMGRDPEKVALLAASVIRGMHDGGVLSVCKHYPGESLAHEDKDTHMLQVLSDETAEDLLERNLIPYLRLNEMGLLDGLMVRHNSFPKIDPDYPASLSKKTIDVIKEQGFNGFTITDALVMNSIISMYGDEERLGLAIAAGNTFPLVFDSKNEHNYNAIKHCYEKGMFSLEQLESAVKTVLETQKKAFEMYKETEISESEENLVKSINKDSVFAMTDDGVDLPISRDGKHYFVLMVDNETHIDDKGKVAVDTFSKDWHFPTKIEAKLKELFPNSIVKPIFEFPTQLQSYNVIMKTATMDLDDVVFITFSEFLAYAGGEQITYRIVKLLEALQQTDTVSTLIHFGNPKVLEPLPHFKRKIIGGHSVQSVETCLEVLAGNYPAKGTLTYDVKFK